MFVLGDWK